MTVIVDLLVPAFSIDRSCGGYLENTSSRNVIIVRKSILEVFSFSSHKKPFLHLTASLALDDEIQAICTATQADDFDIIVVLTHNCLRLIRLSGSSLQVMAKIAISTTRGHQLCQETLPIINRLSESKFLLYRSTGFITIVDVHDFLGITLPIGSITVRLLTALANGTHFAALYRDFEFRFSLRYYKVDSDYPRCIVENQFEDFKEAPSLLIPLPSGGVMVVSDLCIYLFPGPHQKALVSDTLVDSPNFKVSLARNVVTLHMVQAPYLGSSFKAFSPIDEKRYLLTSENGQSLIVYVDAQWSSTAVTVFDFRVLDLQRSTPSESLVHIQGNIFFASSRTSRSILFRILQEHPYIGVLAYFPASPPIFSLDYISDKASWSSDRSLLTCQGGFNGGEFRKYLAAFKKLKKEQTINLRYKDPKRLHIVETTRESLLIVTFSGSDSVLDVFKLDHKTSTIDFLDPQSLMEAAVGFDEIEGNIVQQNKNDFDCQLPGGIHVSVSDKLLKVSGASSLELTLSESPSSVSAAVINDKIEILVSFFSGLLQVFQFKDAKLSLILEPKLEENCFVTSSLIIPVSRGLKLLLFIDQTGSTWQLLCNSKGDISRSKSSSCKTLPAFSSHRNYLLLDKHSVSLLEEQENSEFYQIKEIKRFTSSVVDCLGFSNQTIVLLNDGSISVLEHSDDGICVEANFHDKLLVKSKHVPNTNLSLVLDMEMKVNRQTRRLEKNASLHLVNEDTLEIVDTHKTRSESNYTDFCFLQADEDLEIESNFFVVSNSDKEWSEALPIFMVKKQKIVFVSKTQVNGKVPSLMSIQKVIFNNSLHAIGSDYVMFDLQKSGETFEWHAITGDKRLGLSTFGVDATWLNESLVAIGDASNGIYVTDGRDKLQKLYLPHEPWFITAISSTPAITTNRPILFYGDSLGNIAAITLKGLQEEEIPENELFFLNLGSQINVITPILNEAAVYVGTVDGGIYKIVYDSDLEVSTKTFEELKKSANKSDHITRYSLKWRHDGESEDEEETESDSMTFIDGRVLRHWKTLNAQKRSRLRNCSKEKHTLDQIALGLEELNREF